MATSSGRGSGHSPDVTKNLKGIEFPADKQDLLKQAQQLKAEKVVIDEIKKMDDKEYSSMADVKKSFGHGGEESSSKSSSNPSSNLSSSQKGQQGQQAGQGKSHGKSHK